MQSRLSTPLQNATSLKKAAAAFSRNLASTLARSRSKKLHKHKGPSACCRCNVLKFEQGGFSLSPPTGATNKSSGPLRPAHRTVA